MGKIINMKDYTVFFDFDNTITTFDVMDDMLERFSVDNRWVELEHLWKQRKIGTRDCLERQMKSIRISRKRLNEYLSKIRIDPYFKRLLKFLKSKNIKTMILSDNFDYVLKAVLNTNGVRGLTIRSNHIKLRNNRLIPSFPHNDKNCPSCAHCKTKSISTHKDENSKIVYVGDGLSDLCPSRTADVVFAKDELRKYLDKSKIAYIPYRSLKDVYGYVKEELDGSKTKK